jgi:hypothetical protein
LRDEIRTTLEAYARSWEAGDLAAVFASYHDDFTLHYAGANALSGVHQGKAAAREVLAEFSRRTGRRLLGILDVMAGDERGVVIAREGLGLGDETREVERVLVYTVTDGRLHHCWVYDEDQAWIDGLIGS